MKTTSLSMEFTIASVMLRLSSVLCAMKSTRYTVMACIVLCLFGYALNASAIHEQASAAKGIENLANVDFEFPKRTGPDNPEAALKRAKDWWEKNKTAFQRQ